MPIKVSCNYDGSAFAVYLDLWTTDTHDGSTACISRAFRPTVWPGRDAAVQLIFHEVMQLMKHELAERFHVGDDRPLDPHRRTSV
jgi:hypothetical protein